MVSLFVSEEGKGKVCEEMNEIRVSLLRVWSHFCLFKVTFIS